MPSLWSQLRKAWDETQHPRVTDGPGGETLWDVLKETARGWLPHHAAQEPVQGLYIGRQLTNDDVWREWAASVGLPPLDENLHVTVLYSSVATELPLAVAKVEISPDAITHIDHLGKDNALVVHFEAPELQARWQEAMDAGAVTSYDSFKPHMTLFYDENKAWDGSTIPLPGFPLIFGPESAGPVKSDVFKAWDEAKHPREKDGPGGAKDGRFKSKGAAPVVRKIVTVRTRAFAGKSVPVKTPISKQEAGALGEALVIAHLKSLGSRDASSLNVRRNNFPVDLVHDHRVIEVKTGLISNSERAQQWRMTIGQPGPKETAMLKRMSPEKKKAWNAKKQAAIAERKKQAVAEYSKRLKTKVKGTTITVILHPDKRLADIYEFPGFHQRIGWNTPAAKKAYRRTVKYS